jgi:GNAT superfamily N-acetyltransferase
MMSDESAAAGFDPLLEEVERLQGFDVRLGGGWGIDVLAGRVTRNHHDVDLFVRREDLEAASSRFVAAGFEVILDLPGARMVLESPDGRRIDLNGLAYRTDGDAVQADPDGDIEVFAGWGWTTRRIGSRDVVCLTAEAQRFKHRGYAPRLLDAADLEVISGIDEPARFDPTVREIESGEEDLIAGIETASDRLLQPFGLWPLPPSPPHAKRAEKARTVATLVAGRPPVGFIRLERVDGHTHIGQLSVMPECGGLGIGGNLMEAGCRFAEELEHPLITLTTFVDVPFNAPWYRRLGFEDLAEPFGPEMALVVAEESELAACGARVAMGRRLRVTPP